jgi:lysyl-tRNA synthetase class 2
VTGGRGIVRVEHHPLGPRVHILGRRVHEWHLGAGLLVVLAALDLLDVLTGGVAAYALAFAGIWAIVKDWRDLTPHLRDTAAWRVGVHRRPGRLRGSRRADWVPPAAAAGAVALALSSLATTLVPGFGWDGHLVAQLTPVRTAAVFHAAVIPVCWALLVAGYALWRRRRRACDVAVALLLLLGLIDVLAGPEVEEALVCWTAAGLLWYGRESFVVEPGSIRVRLSIWTAAAVTLATLVFSTLAAWTATPGEPSVDRILWASWDLLTWRDPPVPFRDEFRFVPHAVGVLSLFALVIVAWAVFRPLAAARALPDPDERDLARRLVAMHGDDALSYFKLRSDKQYLWGEEGDALIGYRVENRVLLVSGDPVGPEESVRGLMGAAVRIADRHDLRFAVVGASQGLRDWAVSEGLRAVYIGDEAVVSTREFSLEGRAIRKVRQSVTRMEKAGYSAEVVEMRDATDELLVELDHVSRVWRAGAEERGFSMALDGVGGAHQDDTVLVVSRGPDDRVAAFIQFVPHRRGEAMSLAAMRRLPSTPNGLMEFTIVRSIEMLGADGVEELSLNFVAFGRQLRKPAGVVDHCLGWVLRVADRWFQIERLRRFSEKFAPSWRPRYMIFQHPTALPRCALAVMWAEGQAPRPPTVRSTVREGAGSAPPPS